MSVETEDVNLVGDEVTGNVARAVLFAAVTAATAPISITHPLFPNVPITLQTFWVYLAGVVLGPVWSAGAFALYLVAGTVGLPVFAGGSSGLGVITGPTGGYIVGFVFGAAAVGLVVHGTDGLRAPGDVSVGRLALAIAAGTLVVYAFGGVGLMLVQNMSAAAVVALSVGFLPTALVKAAGTIAVARSGDIPWREAVAR